VRERPSPPLVSSFEAEGKKLLTQRSQWKRKNAKKRTNDMDGVINCAVIRIPLRPSLFLCDLCVKRFCLPPESGLSPLAENQKMRR
jgi:hypothetical protein